MEQEPEAMSNLDVPIALRRSKRRSSVLSSPKKARTLPDHTEPQPEHGLCSTPARRSKRVRFSDPALYTNSESTGITPALRRSSLGTPRERQRRPSTPSRSSWPEDICFTPFKQVLDDRVKRRIRRNGLSNEMNEYEDEKKTKASLEKDIRAKDAELQKLREELEAVRNASEQPEAQSDLTYTTASQQRVDEVEAELEALRQSFALEDSAPVTSWDHVPMGVIPGSMSDGGDTIQIYEDDDNEYVAAETSHARPDADSLVMSLQLAAARQAKQSLLGSFRGSPARTDISFPDSPARRPGKLASQSPKTPRSFYHDLSKQLKATTSRAEDAELALTALETEVHELGFSNGEKTVSTIISNIASHFRQMRLELERTVPGETAFGFDNAAVFPELIRKLKTLVQQVQTKEAELKSARDSHHNMKGNFEKAIIAAEKANTRIKDLETLIDTNAEDMLGLRVRANGLEKDLEEKGKDVDSLTTALQKYRADVSRLEQLIETMEQDHASRLAINEETISDLDAKATAETRGRQAAEDSAISRLNQIQELESTLTSVRDHAATLETNMTALQSQLTSSITTSTSHAEEVGALNARISALSTGLATANAEVMKLKITKSKLEERVRNEVEQATRTVEVMQNDWIRSVTKTNENKKSYIRSAKCRIANWELEDEMSDFSEGLTSVPTTPSSLVRFAEFSEQLGGDDEAEETPRQPRFGDEECEIALPGTVEIARGKRRRSRSLERGLGLEIHTDRDIIKRGLSGSRVGGGRRRYDSGIGMSPSSDDTFDGELDIKRHHIEQVQQRQQHGLITPELSSEIDDVERESILAAAATVIDDELMF